MKIEVGRFREKRAVRRKMENISQDEIDQSAKTFRAVFVPADSSSPVQDVSVEQSAGDALGCFISFAKGHFAKKGLNDKQMEVYKSQVKEHAKGENVSDDLLRQLSETTTVDMIVLHPNLKETDWMSINMYVDDKGVAKQLAPNDRATSICRACGLIQQQVLGDVFIGKQFDNQEGFCRIDFTTNDLNDDSWVRRAHETNTRLLANAQRNQSKLKSIPQPPQKVDPAIRQEGKRRELALRTATRHKESGNGFFNSNKIPEAIVEYTHGLSAIGINDVLTDANEIDENVKAASVLHALLSNRSACFHKTKEYQKALEDSVLCAELRPTWPKAFGRQADALIGLNRLNEAKSALEHAIKLCGESPTEDLDSRLEHVKTLLESK